LQDIFKAIIAQLGAERKGEAMADGESSAAPEARERRLYLLESLSTVKSPLILTEIQFDRLVVCTDML
jgi:hypothetical protein